MSASLHASVVFLRIEDFARRSASEQARLRAQLEAALAVALADLEPAGRVVLEAADGAGVVLLGDPAGALRLARRALAAGDAGVPLAAGINHGPVQVAPRKGEEAMTGDGIAVAASIAQFAAPLRILASRAFRDALAERAPGREASLVPAGTFSDPGLRAHELYGPDREGPRRRSRRYAFATALLVVAALGSGTAARIAVDGQPRFVNAVLDKYPYVRALVRKVSF